MNCNTFELVFVFYVSRCRRPSGAEIQGPSSVPPASEVMCPSAVEPFANSSPRSSASNVLHKRDGIRQVASYGRPLVF